MSLTAQEKTKPWAASSQSIDSFAALPTAADRRQLTSVQLKGDAARWKDQSGVAAESYNSETASSDEAIKRQCDERQTSLKLAIVYGLAEGLFTHT